MFPFAAHPALVALLRERLAAKEAFAREHATLAVPFVFWHAAEDASGHHVAKRIAHYSKYWAKACRDAGCPDRTCTTSGAAPLATLCGRACLLP